MNDMPYTDRRVLDCDAHIMEPPGWLESFAPAAVRDRLPTMDMGDSSFRSTIEASIERRERRRTDAAEAVAAVEEFMTMPRKGWGALGDGDPDERSDVLDLLGFDLQLIFPTGSFPQVMTAEPDVFIPAVMAMNRGLAAFCAGDDRLRSVAYVPMQRDVETALAVLHDAVAAGAEAVMIDTVPPRDGRSPTHPHFDPLWAAIADADLLVTLHVGLDNGWRPVRQSFFDNDRVLEHFRSDAPGDALSFLSIGFGPQLLIGALVLDGVLSRHPGLRFVVAELGATWVPGFLHFLDTSVRSFRRMQDLSHLDDLPSDHVRRHFGFSPFAGEDVGYMIETAGPELFLFNSDYPHHEGTDDPIRRFERTMPDATEADRDAFYAGNLERLLGSRAPAPAPVSSAR